jgi:S1-C subfamily serine protease
VIVKEEDLIVDAIAKNKGTVFAVSKEGFDLNGDKAEISIGRGFAVSLDGIIVVDAMYASGKGEYFIKNDSGKFKADFISTDKAGFSFLKAGEPLDEGSKLTLAVPIFGDLEKMKIGQKVLILGNGISSFIFEGLSANKNMDLNVPKSNAGGLVLNLDGEALGVALSSETVSFASIGVIKDALKVLSATSSKI